MISDRGKHDMNKRDLQYFKIIGQLHTMPAHDINNQF